MAEELASIGQIAEQYDLTLRALRFYEQRGLLQPLRKGTVRLYSARDRVRIKLILKGRQLGFTLNEIEALIAKVPHIIVDANETPKPASALVQNLSRSQIKAQLAHLERQRATVQAGIAELQAALDGAKSARPTRLEKVDLPSGDKEAYYRPFSRA